MKGELQGRVVYLEPNDFRNQIGASYGSGDNVYWRPEDLSIAVDLQVIIPDRNSCGSDIYENFNVTINSKEGDSRWTSFFRGTEINGEPYLTDSFTDISYQEISQNRAGSKEALGIKSIDIQFDAHFYPVVKMRLVDVRGASLMMPAEANFEEKEKVCQEFFNALFHFPYPRFALSIKGFYGTRVTFMLAVNDFQSAFNSQTGNFDVEVSFIGHMYGLYTDIPMSCLLVAPYMGAGTDTVSPYWRAQTSKNGAFFFCDGSPIPTFKKFFLLCQDLPDKFKLIYSEEGESFENLKEVESLMNEERAVVNLRSEYEDIIKDIKTVNLEKDCKVVTINGYNVYFINSNSYSLPSAEKFKSDYVSYLDICGEGKSISLPKGFGETDSLLWGKNNIDVNNSILVAAKPSTTEGAEKEYVINDSNPLYDIVSGISESLKCADYANKYAFTVEVDEEFIGRLDSRITKINEEKDKKMGESSEELNELTKKLLGFAPTIENIIRMTFAHIDAFMHEYYNLLDAFKGNSAIRKSTNFKTLQGQKITDDVDARGGDYTYPPFPGFFQDDEKTGERVRKYPGTINELSKGLYEVNFVERIFRAIDAAESDMIESAADIARKNSEPATKKKDEWVPLSVLDATEDKNPYGRFTVSAGENYINKLLVFIWNRFNTACAYTKAYEKDGIRTFPVGSEIENFWSIHGDNIVNCSNTELTQIKQCIDDIIGENSTKNILKVINKNKKSNIDFTEYSTFAFKSAHYIVPEENSWILAKMSNLPITFDVKTSWDYKVDKGFLSNVYHKDCFKDEDNVTVCNQKNINEHTKNRRSAREEWTENAAIENRTHGQYMFPILQFYDENYAPCNFFSDMSGELTNIGFLSSFIGTTDIYRFSKKDSSIRRIPKVFALYLGSLLRNNVENFNIDKEGYYNLSADSKIAKESNGFETADIKKRDENDGLGKYYSRWAAEYGVNKFKALFDSAYKKDFRFYTSYKDNTPSGRGRIKDSGYYTIQNCATNYTSDKDSSINEYTKEMVDLASSMVTVLSLYPANEKMTPRFKNIVSFFRRLKNKIEEETKNSNNATATASEGNTDEIANAKERGFAKIEAKEQMYYTLKNLYDKWLSCYNRDRFKLSDPENDRDKSIKKNAGKLPCTEHVSEVQCFMYVDTFYQNIGDKLLINPYKVAELIGNLENRSVMQFIADIAQENKLLFIALPVFSNMYDSDTIGSIFTPQSIYGENEFTSKADNSRGIGNTYVLMYTHEPSHFNGTDRNKNTPEFKKDKLVFSKDTKIVTLNELQQDGKNYTIPAFGVTFSKQDQMYFKNINVNMANPKETDISIANKFILADSERRGDSRLSPNTVGQDLYSIYSNRSYECSVDMMGCANIMPLMYFQLNNIPLFNGAYLIYGVKHHIENGSMTTSFTGIRVSSNAIPINPNVIDVESLLNNLKRSESGAGSGMDNITIGEGSAYQGSVSSEMQVIDNAGNVLNESDGVSTTPMEYDEKLPVLNIPKGIKYFKEHGVKAPWISGTIYPYSVVNFEKGTGACAQSVKDFLRAALSYDAHVKNISTCNGFACSNQIERWGYKKIAEINNNKTILKFRGPFEPGDICCSRRPGTTLNQEKGSGENYGHIAIFDGNTFVSDCVQTGVYANGIASKTTNGYILYRYKGPVIPPDFCTVISFDIEEGITVRKSSEGRSNDGEIIENGRNIIIKNPHMAEGKCDIYFQGVSDGAGISAEVISYNGDNDSGRILSNAVTILQNKKEALVSLCSDDIGKKVVIKFAKKINFFQSIFG